MHNTGAANINKIAIAQLLQFCYALGTQTLIEGVWEFSPHSLIQINYANGCQISQKSYWEYRLTEDNNLPETALLDHLSQLFDDMFQTYANAIKKKNWSAGVPLSGGMDSRFLAWGFSKNDIPLKAYTWGTSGYGDLELASETADSIQIPINKIVWEDEKPFTGKRHDELVRLIGPTTKYSVGIGSYGLGERFFIFPNYFIDYRLLYPCLQS